MLPVATAGRPMLTLAVLAAYICMIDRIAMSIAVIPMVDTFGWSPSDQGLVLSAFFIGYLVLQVPAGWLSDRFGGKWVLGFGVLFWSLFTVLTPASASAGLIVLVLCRFLMGVGESVTWPAIYNLISRWVEPARRSTALGLLNSSISGGTIIALVATPWIIGLSDWRMAFYVYGALGLLWFALWSPLIPNRVQALHAADRPLQLDDSIPSASPQPTVRWSSLVKSKPVIALVIAHFCTNWVVYLSLAWTPTFLAQAFSLPLERVGVLSMLPFALSAVGTPLAGRLGDWWLSRGVDRSALRRGMQGFAMVGIAAGLIMVGLSETVTGAVLGLCLGNFAAAASVAGFGSNHMDLAPEQVGTLYGVSNAIGSLGSAAAVYVAGLTLELTQSWLAVFSVAAGVALIGGTVFWIWGSAERQI